MKPALLAAALMLAPAAAHAQANVCGVPDRIAAPHAVLPSDSDPARQLPIGSYTLALSWSPEFCRTRSGSGRSGAGADFQCGSGNSFGFVLHGLWPDGVGKEWPQYCRATPVLPTALLRQHLCTTPSAQLLQHEWAKHGTCIPGTTPARYFARAGGMFTRLRFPNMAALSRQALTVGEFQRRFAAANRMSAGAVRVTTKPGGWLDELWLCADTRLRYGRCDANQGGGAPAGARLRIWRGEG